MPPKNAEDAAETERTEEAIGLFNKVLEITQGDARAYANLGTLYSKKGNTFKSCPELTKSRSHKRVFCRSWIRFIRSVIRFC